MRVSATASSDVRLQAGGLWAPIGPKPGISNIYIYIHILCNIYIYILCFIFYYIYIILYIYIYARPTPLRHAKMHTLPIYP